MNDKPVVHFGAGALGRGLVVPMLYGSHRRIVIADTDPRLIAYLKERKSYKLQISDDCEHPVQIIPIEDVISPIEEEYKLITYLQNADIVTTSVRKENLIHVARVISKAWRHMDCHDKCIICCENVEGIGSYFKTLLLEITGDNERENLVNILVPDTIVDRICAVKENVEEVISETFHECSVDKDVLKDTGMALIPSVDHIRAHFYRKRYLLNTYADAMAFIGKRKGHTYLYECAVDEHLQIVLQPYIKLLEELLYRKFGITHKESEEWFQTYQRRLSNDQIPRNLDTVARNLWDKLSVSERFVCPLLDLMELDVPIEKGLSVIHNIIQSQAEREQLTQDAVNDRLKELWNVNEQGKKLYQLYKNMEHA